MTDDHITADFTGLFYIQLFTVIMIIGGKKQFWQAHITHVEAPCGRYMQLVLTFLEWRNQCLGRWNDVLSVLLRYWIHVLILCMQMTYLTSFCFVFGKPRRKQVWQEKKLEFPSFNLSPLQWSVWLRICTKKGKKLFCWLAHWSFLLLFWHHVKNDFVNYAIDS